jgi:hypothetical protein
MKAKVIIWLHRCMAICGIFRCLRRILTVGMLPMSLVIGNPGVGHIRMTQLTHAQTLEPDPQQVAALQGTRHDIIVSARADRSDATYRIGDQLSLRITSNADVFLTILSIGGSGKVNVMIPNATEMLLRASAGRPIEVPAPSGRYAVRVQGPPGLELIKIVATTEPIESPVSGVGALAYDLPRILERRLANGYTVADVVIRIVDAANPVR